jgi:predicted nucleotide-binding protein
MRERFKGAGEGHLLDALRRQELADGNLDIALAFKKCGELVEFAKGDKLIDQYGEDNDVFLLISGAVAIVVKGNQLATRKAGQQVGEMAAIEPALKRSADVIALDTVVALKISSPNFVEIGRSFPQIWLPLARELSRRLYQRNDLIPPPNEFAKLFIISSTEGIEVARQIQAALERDVFSTIWDQGVFFGGGYPIEALERAVDESDFAMAIAQAEDIIEPRGSRSPTLRDNVLFELGLFMGKLSRHRAILVYPRTADLKLPSDLHGLTMIEYQQGTPEELQSRLGPVCTEIHNLVSSLGVRKLNANFADQYP